jgi:hypothetical protein
MMSERSETFPNKYIRYRDGEFQYIVSGEVVLTQNNGETFAEFEERINDDKARN